MWVTEKDGIVMDLLAAEMMARTGLDASQLYAELARDAGAPVRQALARHGVEAPLVDYHAGIDEAVAAARVRIAASDPA